jgi:P pilus assembly chaperone PapD
MKKLAVNTWLVMMLIGFWACAAGAQVDMVISPIRAEHQVAAGSSETNIIQVRNEGTKPERVRVYLEDWTMNRQGDVTYSRPGKNPNSCASWIQLNPTDFRLDPGTREVRYTITVPPTARPGSYWSVIIFEGMPATEAKPKGRKMGVHGRIGTIIYITLGNPEIKPNFQDLKVKAGKKEPVFTLTLRNEGTGYFRLHKSFISVKNSQGQEVARIEIPEIPVLPATTRDLEINLNKALPKGDYLAEAVLDVGRRDFLGRKVNFTVGK